MTTINGNEEFIKVTPIESWAEIWENCHDSRWLLWMLEWVPHTDSELRLFACWCARQAWRILDLVIYEGMVEMAERHALGKADRQEMTSLWEKCRGGAAGAGVCGMPKCIPSAAVQLASFQTCRDEARQAAWWSAYYAVRAAGFKAAREEADRIDWERNCAEKWRESYRVKSFIDKNPSIAKEAEEIARNEQADGMREIMGNPMERSKNSVAISAQTLAYWMIWGFVPEKVHGGDWQFSSDLLGAQYSFNTLVEKFSPSGVVVCTTHARDQIPCQNKH